jgi:hypothetical protein
MGMADEPPQIHIWVGWRPPQAHGVARQSLPCPVGHNHNQTQNDNYDANSTPEPPFSTLTTFVALSHYLFKPPSPPTPSQVLQWNPHQEMLPSLSSPFSSFFPLLAQTHLSTKPLSSTPSLTLSTPSHGPSRTPSCRTSPKPTPIHPPRPSSCTTLTPCPKWGRGWPPLHFPSIFFFFLINFLSDM